MVAVSRLSSFRSQTRTRTVIGRPPKKSDLTRSQLRIPLPARIAPKVGNARAADASVPCPRKKRAIQELVWPVDFTRPWKTTRLLQPPGGFPTQSAEAHSLTAFLRTSKQ